MNKNAIQKYAIWARNELIEQVKQRAYQYGITEKGYGEENASVIAGRVLTADEKRQRQSFVVQIKERGFTQAVEEAVYTWFNRFVALRYMEVNDYLPTHVRVFSDASGGFNPEILKNVLHLDLEGLNKAKVSELLNANKTEELYRYLLLTQCNALNVLLPEMFEKLGGYTEMLLPNNILKQGSVLARLVKDIPEEDWKDAVQIIGWMYQYYNTEPKQAVFDGLKKNVKITKEKIPAATQLFTPDWIVRYMVENSLGRVFISCKLRVTSCELGVAGCETEIGRIAREKEIAGKFGWKYYLPEAEQTPEVRARINSCELRVASCETNELETRNLELETIKVLDPCMGSGHILVYVFDVLMQIYESEGYNPRDAAKLILEKNIYGLDIDRRACQLAWFALMMKARQYSRRILADGVKPQVYHPAGFPDGEEYGSLLRVASSELQEKPEKPDVEQTTLFDDSYAKKLNTWNFRRLLAQKYDVVVTNPPYMGNGGMGAKIAQFVKDSYPDSKSDLFAVFIERCGKLLRPTGYQAMITQHAWMFLSSYEKLRSKLIQRDIVNMAHLGARAFEEIGGEVVQTTAFVLSAHKTLGYLGTYVRLVDFGSQDEKEAVFLSGEHRHTATADNFAKIPGSPVAYWVSEAITGLFVGYESSNNMILLREGIHTADNERFLRIWHEVVFSTIVLNAKTDSDIDSRGVWVPYSKGGTFRKWYGNNELVIGWSQKHRSSMQALKFHVRPSQNLYFKEGATWSALSSGKFGLRKHPAGHLFDSKGQVAIGDRWLEIMALFNTKAYQYMADILMPTLDYKCGDVKKLPYCPVTTGNNLIIAEQNVQIAKADWDAFETSWDFTRHPLVPLETRNSKLATIYSHWDRAAAARFQTLKSNEEELNRIFISIYGLQDELTPEVDDKDVTVRRADLGREIRSLISYAVGCMFGRYSLDREGLIYAGGDWKTHYSQLATRNSQLVTPNSQLITPDNILPICDDEYFDDDIVGRFVAFIKTVYGADTLEENLRFIANALPQPATRNSQLATSNSQPATRNSIRSYFLNDFYKDHLKIYQKRPIYWLFDSGKKNGFKALIYMHRYSSDLLAKLRTDYVHEQQERYRTQLNHIAAALNTAQGAERAKLLKQQDKLTEQAKEIGSYEEKIHHLADQNIRIDLDDGVKKNYAIFADVLAQI